MKSALPLVLNLRVGCYTAAPHPGGTRHQRAAQETGVARLPEWGGDNAWGLDALLAVAEETPDGPENSVLRLLHDCLRGTPGDGDLTPLLPGLLDSVSCRFADTQPEGVWRAEPELAVVL